MTKMITQPSRTLIVACVAACATLACSPASGDAASQTVAASQAVAQTDEDTNVALQAATMPPATREVTFVVRFAADHPLGQAQRLQAAGRSADAERLARESLREAFALQGLCFGHFTVGGAEIVLVACTAPEAGQEEAFRHLWVSRFTEMAGVEHAEVNRVAQPASGAPA